jgi:hypothetical protein
VLALLIALETPVTIYDIKYASASMFAVTSRRFYPSRGLCTANLPASKVYIESQSS